MPPDSQHARLPGPGPGVEHHYGPDVHVLSYGWPMALLTELCAPETTQPRFNQLVGMLYDWLLGEVVSRELKRINVSRPTRMAGAHPAEGVYRGERIDPAQRVVVAAVARGGILPGQRFFDGFNQVLDPASVRQDHLSMARVSDPSGKVVGVDVSGSKLGGRVDDAVLVIPDPMGATGGSMVQAFDVYRELGAPRARVAVHLIVTPEAIRRVQASYPGTKIYAVRLDRGLSAAEVLDKVPGALWDRERGLNDHSYIVPGAGGVGELMNNSWV